MSETKSRRAFLDIAKGISMVWIVAVHAAGAPYTNIVGYIFLIPLWFVCAGYLWKEKDTPLREQLPQRCIPLLRPYLLYNAILLLPYVLDWRGYWAEAPKTVVYEVCKRIFGIFYAQGILWADDTSSFFPFCTVFNYPLWFLPAMATASAAFLLMLQLRREKGICLKKMVLPCLLITELLTLLPIRLPWSLGSCLFSASLMAAGMYFRRTGLLERQWRRSWLEALCYVGLFGLTFLLGWLDDAPSTSIFTCNFGPYGFLSVLMFFLGGISGSLVLLRVSRLLERFSVMKFFSFIGRNTIPILALHRLFITYYNRLWEYFIGPRPELSTPMWFLFNTPRILIGTAGPLVLVCLCRFLKKKFQAPVKNRAS
ncbi:MAG: acyltransferase [Oscillospiraceae bacterium]|nr:acyltransferase [Oscillospiraceae bacterium]